MAGNDGTNGRDIRKVWRSICCTYYALCIIGNIDLLNCIFFFFFAYNPAVIILVGSCLGPPLYDGWMLIKFDRYIVSSTEKNKTFLFT